MKVYILCPPKFFTGGPVGLHQLCQELRANGIDALIFYPLGIGKKGINPVHENFESFKNPYTTKINDSRDDFLIVPEIFTSYFSSYPKINKVIWWLSVDNYFIYNSRFKESIVGKIKTFFKRNPWKIKKIKNNVVLNLAQSAYAFKFLYDHGLRNALMLHDYVPLDFFKNCKLEEKQNLVLYNPKKGFDFTQKLIIKKPNLTFIPLINLSPEQVIEMLMRSKVYIDFGEHPGRDRFPREAAILGNVVITGKDGSAGNSEDISISPKYKFDQSSDSIELVLNMIEEVMVDHEAHFQMQSDYRNEIYRGKKIFQDEVLTLLTHLNIPR